MRLPNLHLNVTTNPGVRQCWIRSSQCESSCCSQYPACIYLRARSPSNAEAVVKFVHETHPDASIEFLQLDLSSFDNIRDCAAKFNQKSDRLDLLFFNAGISTISPDLMNEGYESQFGINHLGHVLLTRLLMPNFLQTMRKNGLVDARIMVITSVSAHDQSPKQGLARDQMKSSWKSLQIQALELQSCSYRC